MELREPSSGDAYTNVDKWLHRLALQSPAVMETAFDLESTLYGEASRKLTLARPVFVCGLARAGTSLITRLLDATGEFSTLRYRDMPFVMAPNLWARLSSGNRRRIDRRERGHGDGLAHDLDTPEALEEAFWRCFEGDHYIAARELRATPPGRDTLERYEAFVRLIMLRDGQPRYLAKNNNNILRLGALARTFPDAIFVHPFRHPERQAVSLHRQHLRAKELHANDPFRRSYMRWLGHHEFGPDHRPFALGPASDPCADPTDIAYWRAVWSRTHAYLLAQAPVLGARQVFVDHDALRREPIAVLRTLATVTGSGELDADRVELNPQTGPAETMGDLHAALVAMAAAHSA